MMTNTAHIHAKHLQLNITTKKFHMLRNKFFLLNVYHCHHFPSSLMFFLAMYSNQEHFSSHPISHPGPAHQHQVPPASHHYLTREAPYLLHAGASRLASLPHTRAPHTCTRCLPPRITTSYEGPHTWWWWWLWVLLLVVEEDEGWRVRSGRWCWWWWW